MPQVNGIALVVFVLLFGFITWLGFAAARWRRGDLDQLHEWGLGGRRFGTVVTWFLVDAEEVWVEAAAPVRTRTTTKARTICFMTWDSVAL